MEIWKDFAGYEGIYQVSNFGRVKSLDRVDSYGRKHKGKVLLPRIEKTGYLKVHLSKENQSETILVHRLVADAFCEKKDGCNIVNHIDNNKTNNNANNLEWTTYKGNMQHASKQGRMHYNPKNLKRAIESRKKTVIAIDDDGNQYIFSSQTDAMRKLNLSYSMRGHIAGACKDNNGCQTIGGYRWRYANEKHFNKDVVESLSD